LCFIAARPHIFNKMKQMLEETFTALFILLYFTGADGFNLDPVSVEWYLRYTQIDVE